MLLSQQPGVVLHRFLEHAANSKTSQKHMIKLSDLTGCRYGWQLSSRRASSKTDNAAGLSTNAAYSKVEKLVSVFLLAAKVLSFRRLSLLTCMANGKCQLTFHKTCSQAKPDTVYCTDSAIVLPGLMHLLVLAGHMQRALVL